MASFVAQYWPWIALAAAIAGALLLSRVLLGPERPPYEKRESLLTKAELKFYHALSAAVEGKWSVCAMVRLADLIRVRPKAPSHQAWLNRIRAKHIDFVLCDRGSMEARLAIELDDASHERADRIERDQFVDDALQSAGLPILRIKVAKEYDPAELRQSIKKSVA